MSPSSRRRRIGGSTSQTIAGARGSSRSRSCSAEAARSPASWYARERHSRATRTPVTGCGPGSHCRSAASGGCSGAARRSGRTTTWSPPTSATPTTSSPGGPAPPIAERGRGTSTTGPGAGRSSRPRRGRRRGSRRRADNRPQVEIENTREPRRQSRGAPARERRVRPARAPPPRQRARQARPARPPGRALGRCGNSGNSSEPHLHFHVQDRATLFGPARGLPIAFAAMRPTVDTVVRGTPVQGEFLRPRGS